jgi:hypothetical protein
MKEPVMSANKPKQQETGRKPRQEEDEVNRQNPDQSAEKRHDRGNPGQGNPSKNKNPKSGDFEDR